MKKILLVLIAIVGLIAGVLLSEPGRQRVLLPLVNTLLEMKVPGHRVVVTRLEPGPGTLKAAGTVDGTIRFTAEGPVDWLERSAELTYRIRGKTVRVARKNYPLHLDLTGGIRGTPERMVITGEGRGLDADLRYRVRLRNFRVTGAEIDARGASVGQLLALAGRPPFADGRLDLTVNLPKLEGKNSEGTARFSVRKGSIDPGLLEREFGIRPPAVKGYRLEGSFRLAKGLIRGEAGLRSPLADLALSHFRCDAGFRVFKSGYSLEIPELSQLSRITKAELYGPLKSGGEFYFDRRSGRLQIRGRSPSLEGESRFFYDGGRLKVVLNGVGIPQVIALSGQPALAASGTLDGTLYLSDLQALEGNFTLRARGRWDRKEIEKILGSDPGGTLDFDVRSDGGLRRGILELSARYENPMARLEVPTLRYAVKEGAMEGSYRLDLPDLRRLKGLKRVKGSFPARVEGTVKYLPVKRQMKVEGRSTSLGGEIRFLYGGGRLLLTLKETDAVKVLTLAGGEKPPLKHARLDATVSLNDLEKRTGEFRLEMRGALDRQKMRERFGVDPGGSFPLRLTGAGKLDGERIDSRWSLTNDAVRLEIGSCTMDTAAGSCKGKYTLKVSDLRKLRFLTGGDYQGPLALEGKILLDKKLRLDGGGRQWGGEFAYVLDGDRLRVRGKKLDVKALLKMLGYTPLIEGNAAGDLQTDIASGRGTLAVTLRNARLVPGPVTMVASRLLHNDLAKEVFEKAQLTARLEGTRTLFDLKARSRRILMEISRGEIDRAKGTVDALLTLSDRGKRYRMKISGSMNRPTVVPLLSDTLIKKAQKEIRKRGLKPKVRKKADAPEKKEENSLGSFIKNLF